MDSSICKVCGVFAKAHESFCMHYGARTCLSCKAFFRRIFRELKHPEKIKCKAGGQCDLSASKRTACRKCRLDKCIQVGMKPDKVPNKEESKQFTYSNKRNIMKLSKKLLKNLSQDYLGSDMTAMMDFIFCTFEEASKQAIQVDGEATIEQVLNGHLSSIWTHQHTCLMFKIRSYHLKLFGMFAEKIPLFVELDNSDKNCLVEKNFGIYSSLIFAMYVSADNGYDQLCSLLGVNMPCLCERI